MKFFVLLSFCLSLVTLSVEAKVPSVFLNLRNNMKKNIQKDLKEMTFSKMMQIFNPNIARTLGSPALPLNNLGSCGDGMQTCGSGCCASAATCCVNAGGAASCCSGQKCCNAGGYGTNAYCYSPTYNTCCPGGPCRVDQFCCGQGCCNNGTKCCGGQKCCSSGTYCCGVSCCSESQVCCPQSGGQPICKSQC